MTYQFYTSDLYLGKTVVFSFGTSVQNLGPIPLLYSTFVTLGINRAGHLLFPPTQIGADDETTQGGVEGGAFE